jgi:hypothetical protein
VVAVLATKNCGIRDEEGRRADAQLSVIGVAIKVSFALSGRPTQPWPESACKKAVENA